MSVCLVCLLEELSAKRMLKSVLPRLFPEGNVEFKYIVFEGKQDLEKRVERRIRAWLTPNSCFLVMRDQDEGNCRQIKQTLMDKVKSSGMAERTVVRIACRELESFYLGDLNAVERGLHLTGVAKKQNQKKYRMPDNLVKPSQELETLVSQKKKMYQKVLGSTDIAPYLKIDGSNKSVSFNMLLEGVRSLVNRCRQ